MKKITVHFVESETTIYATATANAGKRQHGNNKKAVAIKAVKKVARSKLAANEKPQPTSSIKVKAIQSQQIYHLQSKQVESAFSTPNCQTQYKHNTWYKTTVEVKTNADFANLMPAISQPTPGDPLPT